MLGGAPSRPPALLAALASAPPVGSAVSLPAHLTHLLAVMTVMVMVQVMVLMMVEKQPKEFGQLDLPGHGEIV